MERILIIKHSALGDMVLSFGPMRAIRDAHPDAEITLLTTAPYEQLCRQSGLVDRIWLDAQPKLWRLAAVLNLRAKVRGGGFNRIYDLQTSNRTASYFRLLGPGPKPEWSGIAAGCSHPHINPNRDHIHIFEARCGQLAEAGIAHTPLSDLSWWQSDIARLALPERYAVILPGGAAHRPGKRWPPEAFAKLAIRLADQGGCPVLVGGPPEQEAAAIIQKACPDALNLLGQTSLFDLAPVMRGASVVIGNDTGPMHVAALVGTACIVMFGEESNPTLNRPLSPDGAPEPRILQVDNLQDLPAETVWQQTSDILRGFQVLPLSGQ